MFNCLLLVVTLLLCSSVPHIEPSPTKQTFLRGITVKNWPFVEKQNGTFKGFLVDMMDMIGDKVGFRYELHYSTDSAYNTDYNYKLFRIVSDVFSNKADFALADLTITDARKRYIEFSEPFLEYQLAAIIRKDSSVGLSTLQDLVNYNFEAERYWNISGVSKKNRSSRKEDEIAYGTITSRATIHKLSTSADPTAVHIFNWMERHPEAYVRNRKQGIEKVLKGRYAFLVDSIYADYVVGGKCNLTVLSDTKGLYPRQFAIALTKGSPHRKPFDKAIRELKQDGSIAKLMRKYWTNKCV